MTRRRKCKEYPQEWPHVHINCACPGGRTVAIGTKALQRYDEATGDERVIRCGVCRQFATWEVVEDNPHS